MKGVAMWPGSWPAPCTATSAARVLPVAGAIELLMTFVPVLAG
jgi:hypothetical protein